MADEALEFGGRPELRVCRSGREMKALIEGSKALSKDKDFVLLLDYDASLAMRVLPAYINARVRVADGIARSRGVQMEMLLLVSGTMNIGKALREHGADDPGRFMVFATSGKAFRRFASGNDVHVVREIALKLDMNAAGDVALTELSDK